MISRSVRSVTKAWSNVPRDLSTQMAPAVAAGAASSTMASWTAITVWRNSRPIAAASARPRDRPVRRPPGQRQADEQQAHIERPQRVDAAIAARRSGSRTRRRAPDPSAFSWRISLPKAPTALVSNLVDAGALGGRPTSFGSDGSTLRRASRSRSPSSPHRMARHRGHRPRSTADSTRRCLHSWGKYPARQATRLKQEAEGAAFQ